MKQHTNRNSLRETIRLTLRVYRLYSQYSPHIFLVMFFYALCIALSPYVTIFCSARLLDELAGLRRFDTLIFWAASALGSGVLLMLLSGALLRRQTALKRQITVTCDRIMADKLFSINYDALDHAHTYDLFSQVEQNSHWNVWGMPKAIMAFPDLMQSMIGIVGAIVLTVSLFTLPVPATAGALIFLNHPLFVLLFLLLLFLISLASPLCQTKSSSYWVKISEEVKFSNRFFSSFFLYSDQASNATDIRIYHQAPIIMHYLSQDLIQAERPYVKGPIGIWAAIGSGISAALTGLIYVFVVIKALAGAFGIGAITQYIGALSALTTNIGLLFQTMGELKNNAPFLHTVFELLQVPNYLYQGSLTTEKRLDRQYQVEFRNVSFRYPDSDTWTLRHVNVTFNIGKRMAIVGENGSGKSTFIKLLCRLYDPQEGQILLNGIDIRKYRYQDYLALFSVVFQDFQLLAQPLGANVASTCQYSEPRVTQALIDAGFADRLATLPQGLHTMLYRDFAEDGITVSGGEAQKIAIARALYKDAPFIILDEPTAALDPIAEAEIYSKFNEIVGDKTAIFISHRLSSCKFCDEITVLQGGSIVQHGTHEQLLRDESGQYAKLWNAQAQYYV